MLVPTPTVELAARAETKTTSSALKTSTGYCSDGKHANSAECQKPVSQNGLEIGLGVGIPVFLIMCVLGYFLLRNYRKDKKESLEHDPDFDEIGEATALPDFPAFGSEDPFSGSGQKRYVEHPGMRNQNISAHDLSKYSSRNLDDGFDGFVLPYHHQTGSKASLDEYAKQIMVNKSSFGKTASVHSSLTHLQTASRRSSPQKRNMMPVSMNEPVGNLTKNDFTKLANGSTTSVEDEFYNSKDHFDVSRASLVNTDRFDGRYENEDEATDVGAESETDDENQIHNDYMSQADEIESVADFSDSEDKRGVVGVSPTVDILSPFEDHNELSTTHSAATRDTSTSIGSKSEQLGSPQKVASLKKSPALATLDVLKNASDGEYDQEIEYDPDHKNEGHQEMSKEQEEQLARMKSVYKVYFDRSNSVKSEAPERTSFQVDESQPLPQLDSTHLKVNSNLKADTDYSKRHTTASSVYDAVPIFHGGEYAEGQANGYGYPEQDNRYPEHDDEYFGQQGGYPGYDGGYENGYDMQNSPYGHNEYDQPPQPLAPLQSLPHPSDFRNSSIETFTNYVPRARLVSASKYDSESSLSTPVTKLQPTFGSPGEKGIPPALRKLSGDVVPSATQLSRTSVVMLNPVSEIGPLRKYKPAGSLPSASGSPSMPNSEWAASNDDLIPGNRKSAVRRMMNTNF